MIDKLELVSKRKGDKKEERTRKEDRKVERKLFRNS
jgi:hypothetical protein